MNNLIENIITSIQIDITFALIVLGVLGIVYTVSLAAIFKKIGHNVWYALIPIYNIMTLLSILNMPKWLVLLLFIPFVNIPGCIFMSLLVGYKLGTKCRKNLLIKLGLMLFSPVFYPLLACSTINLEDSKYVNVIKTKSTNEFKLEPVEFVSSIEVPVALNLGDSTNVEKITQQKIRPIIDKKEPSELSKPVELSHPANTENPTTKDLTFDYNSLYNLKFENNTNVENGDDTTSVLHGNVESEQESVEESPIIPIVHDIKLEDARPIDVNNMGPIPINNRYEHQQEANRRQQELIREKEKQELEERKIEPEPIIILDNGPINIDSSLSSLIASAPDFSVPTKVQEFVEVKPLTIDVKPANTTPTVVQDVVSTNIVEPSQLPVGAIQTEQTEEAIEEVVVEPQPTDVVQPTTSQLLRPVFTQPQERVLVDKVCLQCGAKMKRDCPVCIMCGYRF